MKPFIEYNNNVYEFEANFKLKKEFEKEIQARYKSLLKEKVINQDDIKGIQEIQDYVKNNPNLNEETLKNNPEMLEKISKYQPLLDSLILTDIYEKYCFKMLEIKYGIDEETWLKMNEQFYDDYCESIDELEQLYIKVIEKVFTQQVEMKTKKALPEWMVN